MEWKRGGGGEWKKEGGGRKKKGRMPSPVGLDFKTNFKALV